MPGGHLIHVRHIDAGGVGHLVVAFGLVSGLGGPLLRRDPYLLWLSVLHQAAAHWLLRDLIGHNNLNLLLTSSSRSFLIITYLIGNR